MVHTMLGIARYTLRELARNRFAWLFVATALVGLGLAQFLAHVALTETRQFQGAMLGAWLRAAAVFLVSLYVVSSLTRELQDKGFEMLLSLPVPRGIYLAGKLLGYGAAGVLVAVLFGLVAAVHAPAGQAALWAASLGLELWLVVCLSVLSLFTFAQVPAAMATVLGFYLLARTVAALQLMGHGPLLAAPSLAERFAVGCIDAIAWLLPELHRFTRTDWLVYHDASWAALAPLAGQAVVYSALLIAAAAFDLYRKNL